jgi:hypothetical protein
MYQLNPQQLQEFSTLMKLNQYDQAEDSPLTSSNSIKEKSLLKLT